MRKPTVLALFAVMVGLATSASGQIPASPLKDIYLSYNDCFQVATKDGIKPEVLGSLGWSRATVSNGGKKEPSDPAIFGHPTRKPIILLSAEKGEGLCIVMARLENAKAFDEFKSAWGGKLPEPDNKGDIVFFAEGHPIMLRQTGTRREPSMTISVMTPMEKE